MMEKRCSVGGSNQQSDGQLGTRTNSIRKIELKAQPHHQHHQQQQSMPTTSQATGSGAGAPLSMSKLREDVEDCVSSNSQHGFAVVLDDESSTSGVLETYEISSSNSLPTSTGGASNVGVVAVDDSSSTDTLNGRTGSASDHSVSSMNVFFNDPPVVCLINVDDDEIVEDEDVDDEEEAEEEEDDDLMVAMVGAEPLSATTSQLALNEGPVDGLIMTADGSKIFLETPVVEEAQSHPNVGGNGSAANHSDCKPKRISDEFMFGDDQEHDQIDGQLAEDSGEVNELPENCSAILCSRGIKSEPISDASGTDDTDSAGSSSRAENDNEMESSSLLHDRLMSVRLKQMSLTANSAANSAAQATSETASQADIDSMDLIERRDFETEQRLTGGIVIRASSMVSKNKLNLSLIRSCMEGAKSAGGCTSSSDDWPSSSSSISAGRVVSSDSKCTYKDLSTTPTSSRKYTNSRLSKSTAKINLGSSLSAGVGGGQVLQRSLAASCAQHQLTSKPLTASSSSSSCSSNSSSTATATSSTAAAGACTPLFKPAVTAGPGGAARTDAYTSTNSNDSATKSCSQDNSQSTATSTATLFNSVGSQTNQELGCSRTSALHSASGLPADAFDDAQPSTSSARCQYAPTSKVQTRQVNASAQTNERFLNVRSSSSIAGSSGAAVSGAAAGAQCASVHGSNANVRPRRRVEASLQSQRSGGVNDVIVLEVVVEEGAAGGSSNVGANEAVGEPSEYNADEPWANCDEENNCSDLEEVCTCQNRSGSSLSDSNASLSENLDLEAGESFLGDEAGTQTDYSQITVLSQQRKRKYNESRFLDTDYGLSLAQNGSSGATTGDNNCRKRIAYDFASTPRASQHGPLLSLTASMTPTSAAAASFGATSTVASSPMGRRTPRSLMSARDNPPPELQHWLAQFQRWSHSDRLVAVDRLIDHCDPSQVRHMMKVIEPQFQRDFISLLPRELALFVLSYLEPKDLLRAAQTCRSWRFLCDDNLLWKEKCRKAQILTESRTDRPKRGRDGNMPPISSAWKAAYMRQHIIEMNWRSRPVRKPKVLKGHDDHVITCLQFSGNRIVSGSDDNTLKVWSAVNGKCLRTLVGHTGGVWSSQMSGNIIISGSTDRTLKVWDMDSGACVHTLQGHTSTVRCMHLHGNKVVSGSRDATLRVWDIEQGSCLHVLVGHLAAVRCVQYDGKLIVSGAYDYMVKIWRPERQECLHTLQGHTNRVYSLLFDGLHVVSGSLDTSIRVWDVETGNCKHTLMGHQSLTSGMELRQNILVSGNADSTVKVWDITTGQCLQTLSGPNKHQSAVTCLQFNSRFVVTSSDDGTVKLWDVKTGEFIRNLVALDSGGSGGVVWRIRVNDTKLICAVGSRNGTEETKLMVLDFDVEGACVKCS